MVSFRRNTVWMALGTVTILFALTAAQNEGIAVWSNGNNYPPGYATWDDDNGFSTSKYMKNEVMRWRNIRGAYSPTRNEIIIVGVTGDSDKRVTAQMFNGANWNHLPFSPLDTSTSASYWYGFDVRYESQSGNAVLVWQLGVGDMILYRTWNGSTWSSEARINTNVRGGDHCQLHLETNPVSNEMVLIVAVKDGPKYSGVWNGKSWGNFVNLGSVDYQLLKSINVAYEQTSGRALIFYSQKSPILQYRIWNGSGWSREFSVDPPRGIRNRIRRIAVSSDPSSNRIVVGVTSVTDAAFWLAVWDGTEEWGSITLAASGSHADNFHGIAVAFEKPSGRALAAYVQSDNQVRYRTWLNTWSGEYRGPRLGNTPNSVVLSGSPSGNEIMLSLQDNSKDVYFCPWNGKSWNSPQRKTTDTGERRNRHHPFLFLWKPQNGVDSPTPVPTLKPTNSPTPKPTPPPTSNPTWRPTSKPTRAPTQAPTNAPTPLPTHKPSTSSPTQNPTLTPTKWPTPPPTDKPSKPPTPEPTTSQPTPPPTPIPTLTPTQKPTHSPTNKPTRSPTKRPTTNPTAKPTLFPTSGPTPRPTPSPTEAPTARPTLHRTKPPTKHPTPLPTTSEPSASPTNIPTSRPTRLPTHAPTMEPTSRPTPIPTAGPTSEPTRNPTASPTELPTQSPTNKPSPIPTSMPTNDPSQAPTNAPTTNPTGSQTTAHPTPIPTPIPSVPPTLSPTIRRTEDKDKSFTIIPTPVPTTNKTVDAKSNGSLGTGKACERNLDCKSNSCRNGACMASLACHPIKHKYGLPFDKHKINIVFVPSAFDSATREEWRAHVNNTYQVFENFNMFSKDVEQLNVFVVDPEEMDTSFCDFGCSFVERLLCCDIVKAHELASKCFPVGQNLQTVVIHNSPKYGGAGYTYQNIATVSVHRHAPLVAVHELGHSLFQLADEYSYGPGNGADPNCDARKKCRKWSDLVGKKNTPAGYDTVRCLPGCRDNDYYIGMQSFMEDLTKPVGAVNERFTCCTYQVLTKSMPSYCDVFEFSAGYLFDYCKNNDYQDYGSSNYDVEPAMAIPGVIEQVDKHAKYLYVSDPVLVTITKKTRRNGNVAFTAKQTSLPPGIFPKSKIEGDFQKTKAAAKQGLDSLLKVAIRYRTGKEVLLFSPNITIEVPLPGGNDMTTQQNEPRAVSEQSDAFEVVLDARGRGIKNIRAMLIETR